MLHNNAGGNEPNPRTRDEDRRSAWINKDQNEQQLFLFFSAPMASTYHDVIRFPKRVLSAKCATKDRDKP